MALDLNKQISFGKKGPEAKGAASGLNYPTKKTMNLLAVEKSEISSKRLIAIGAVVAVLAILFAKFAVFDQFARVEAKHSELASAQTNMIAAQEQLGDYATVLQEFQQYAGAANSDSTIPDALIVCDMINHVVGKDATITGISMMENTVTVDINDVTLKKVGELDALFMEQEIVSAANVSNASEEDENGKVSAEISLQLIGSVASDDASQTPAGNDLSYNPAAG